MCLYNSRDTGFKRILCPSAYLWAEQLPVSFIQVAQELVSNGTVLWLCLSTTL